MATGVVRMVVVGPSPCSACRVRTRRCISLRAAVEAAQSMSLPVGLGSAARGAANEDTVAADFWAPRRPRRKAEGRTVRGSLLTQDWARLALLSAFGWTEQATREAAAAARVVLAVRPMVVVAAAAGTTAAQAAAPTINRANTLAAAVALVTHMQRCVWPPWCAVASENKTTGLQCLRRRTTLTTRIPPDSALEEWTATTVWLWRLRWRQAACLG